jgi:hypothetical protein
MSIKYEESVDEFVQCVREKLMMTRVEDFGGETFHNYFWTYYDKFGENN